LPRITATGLIVLLIDVLTLLSAGVIIVAIVMWLPALYHRAIDILALREEKLAMTDILDSVLLIVLALDVTRALASAALHRALPVRIVVETAIVAVLREIISAQIRGLGPSMLIALGIVFAVLVAAWVYIGRLEKRGELVEELASSMNPSIQG